MFEYKNTHIELKPIMLGNFDISKLNLKSDDNTNDRDIYYGDDPFYFQTPMITVGGINDTHIKFFDDGSDNYQKLYSMINDIDNLIKNNINNAATYKSFIKSENDTTFLELELDANLNTTPLTSLYVNDGVDVPKICKYDKLKNVLSVGAKVRMVILFDRYIEFHRDKRIINHKVMLVEHVL